MARSCAICGKVSMGGFNPQSSGMNRVRAHRRYKPNLQPSVIDARATPTKALVCTRCRRTQLKTAASRLDPLLTDRSPTRPVVLCPASGGATSFHLKAEVSRTRASGVVWRNVRRSSLNGTSSVEWNTGVSMAWRALAAQVAAHPPTLSDPRSLTPLIRPHSLLPRELGRTEPKRKSIRAASLSIGQRSSESIGRPWPSVSFHSVSSSSSLPRKDEFDRGPHCGPRRPARSGRRTQPALEGGPGKGGLALRELSAGDLLGVRHVEIVEAFDELPGLAAVGRPELADPLGLGRRLRLGRFSGSGSAAAASSSALGPPRAWPRRPPRAPSSLARPRHRPRRPDASSRRRASATLPPTASVPRGRVAPARCVRQGATRRVPPRARFRWPLERPSVTRTARGPAAARTHSSASCRRSPMSRTAARSGTGRPSSPTAPRRAA